MEKKLEKLPTWPMTKVNSKKEVILGSTKKREGQSILLRLMDICHLKNEELEIQRPGLLLRGDSVKNDSGSDAVFTEQGSSAYQMTAEEVMDVIARLPECAGQAADAGSAYTQVNMKDAPKLLKLPKFFHDTSGANLGQTSKILWFLLNEICNVTHLPDSCGKDHLKKSSAGTWVGKKYRIGNAHLFIARKVYSYRYTWMT